MLMILAKIARHANDLGQKMMLHFPTYT